MEILVCKDRTELKAISFKLVGEEYYGLTEDEENYVSIHKDNVQFILHENPKKKKEAEKNG